MYGSLNKQPLFPYTAPADWFFYNQDKECLLRGTDFVNNIQVNFMFQLGHEGNKVAKGPRRTPLRWFETSHGLLLPFR